MDWTHLVQDMDKLQTLAKMTLKSLVQWQPTFMWNASTW